MSEPVIDTGTDADSALSSEAEDSAYDSSSDFIPSDDESDEDSNPGHRSHRPRGNPRDAVRIQTRAQRSNARSDSSSESVSASPLPGRYRYYPTHYELCWENRGHISDEDREGFEYAVFEKTYPELSQFHIPRARREAIMMAYTDNRDSRVSSESMKSICSRSPENDSECIQRSDISPSPQPKCFFNLLPLEVQLQILQYCLTSEAPFLDFCFGYRFATSELACTVPKGQDNVTLGILSTNRHFRALGLRVLWQQNTFLYTRSDEFTLLNTDRLMQLPQITYLRHLVIHQDCLWPPQMFYDRVMLNSILFTVSAAEKFPALRSLHLDLVRTYTKPYCHERLKWLRDTLFEARYFLRDIRAGRMIRHLQEVSMVGISDDDLGCLAVKLASFLVDPGEGRLGVGLVDVGDYHGSRSVGNRFTVIHDGYHEMVYMNVESVDWWLDWRRQQHGHLRKVIDWEDYFPVEVIRDASPEFSNDSG